MADDWWKYARNILCIRLDAIGDVLMTTPALRAVRAGAPDRRITLLGSPSGVSVAPLVPEIDDQLTYAAPWMKASAARIDSFVEHRTIEILRERHFDAAIIFTVYTQSPLPAALLCYLANIPLRLAHCRENPYHLLTDWIPESEPETAVRHEVKRQLDLVKTVGYVTSDKRLSLRVPRAAHQRAVERLECIGLNRIRAWAIIHPGATAPSRRYPSEHFAVVGRTLVKNHDIQLLFTGDAYERALVDEIRREMHADSWSLAGQLELEELAALLALAPVMISNNTGPAHIAAAVGTPVVALYALTNPQHTPWGVSSRVLFHDVPCRCCYKSVCPEGHHDCLRRVPPAAVVHAALELLHSPCAPLPVESTSIAVAPGIKEDVRVYVRDQRSLS